jgi:hypothetical protein
MLEDEMTGLSKLLHGLGYPSSILVALGAFTFGVGIFQSDISLTNRKLLAGLLLIAIGMFLWYAPRIIRTYAVGDHLGNWKSYRQFSFGALVGAVLSAAAIYYLGRSLWLLLQVVETKPG